MISQDCAAMVAAKNVEEMTIEARLLQSMQLLLVRLRTGLNY